MEQITPGPGQRSLNNFYQSVKFQSPNLAEDMYHDVMAVALYGLVADKSPAQGAADRLRQKALDLPEIQKRVLDMALTDLGF